MDSHAPDPAARGASAIARIGPAAGATLAVAGVAILAFFARDAAPLAFVAIAALVALGGAAGVVYAFRAAHAAELAAAREQLAASERALLDLRTQTRELDAAKREADAILGAMRAHLMVVDPSLRIASRYSSELENVFHQSDLGNENFLNVLQRLLSERMFKTARDYLQLLFDGSRKERTVLKVNPLDEVEVNVINRDGSTGLRYLNFGFRRILEGDAVARVLVSVEDITDRTVRERQLRESEQQKVKQFELLLGILHVPPQRLDEFVALTEDQLAGVDDALRASDFASATVGQTALLRQRLDVVLQRVHNVKGNASLLRLEHFEKRAQEFETKIVDLKHRSALGGDDFLTVVIALSEFRSDVDDLQTLRAKLAGISRAARIDEEAGDDLIASVGQLAKTLGAKLGKEVVVDADGFDSRRLPPDRRLVVKDVLIQLTRNSLAHGIEEPAARETASKSRVATIEIHPLPVARPDEFAFVYRDDGRGLDAARIRERAVAAGLLPAERAETAKDAEIAQLIFAPGFSTAGDTTLEAGRGMGMNVVKQRVVDDCGGEIAINSEAGKFCEFSFVLPGAVA